MCQNHGFKNMPLLAEQVGTIFALSGYNEEWLSVNQKTICDIHPLATIACVITFLYGVWSLRQLTVLLAWFGKILWRTFPLVVMNLEAPSGPIFMQPLGKKNRLAPLGLVALGLRIAGSATDQYLNKQIWLSHSLVILKKFLNNKHKQFYNPFYFLWRPPGGKRGN